MQSNLSLHISTFNSHLIYINPTRSNANPPPICSLSTTTYICNPEMSDITGNESQKHREKQKNKHIGLLWKLNPRPLAPKARIIPLDILFTLLHFFPLNEKTDFLLYSTHYKVQCISHITGYFSLSFLLFSCFLLFLYFGSSLSEGDPSTSREANLFAEGFTSVPEGFTSVPEGFTIGLNSVVLGGVLGRVAFTLILKVT